jgi:hypothetical protein
MTIGNARSYAAHGPVDLARSTAYGLAGSVQATADFEGMFRGARGREGPYLCPV